MSSFGQTRSSDVTATIDAPERFTDVDLSDSTVPVYVSGHVGADGPDVVAVAVNGVLGGWYDTSTTPRDAAGQPFQIMFPPSLLRDGNNDVEVFLIEENGDRPDADPHERQALILTRS